MGKFKAIRRTLLGAVLGMSLLATVAVDAPVGATTTTGWQATQTIAPPSGRPGASSSVNDQFSLRQTACSATGSCVTAVTIDDYPELLQLQVVDNGVSAAPIIPDLSSVSSAADTRFLPDGVDCDTTGRCVVAGEALISGTSAKEFLLIHTAAGWQAPLIINTGSSAVNGSATLDCVANGPCVVAGQYRDQTAYGVVIDQNGTQHLFDFSAATPTGTANRVLPQSVSCASATLCVVAGLTFDTLDGTTPNGDTRRPGAFAMTLNGSSLASRTVSFLTSPDPSQPYSGSSFLADPLAVCPSGATSCYVANEFYAVPPPATQATMYPVVFAGSGTTWVSSIIDHAAVGDVVLSSMACPQVGFCLLAGQTAAPPNRPVVAALQNGSWGSASFADTAVSVSYGSAPYISCVSRTACLLVAGAQYDSLTGFYASLWSTFWNGAKWTQPVLTAQSASYGPAGLDCASVKFCQATLHGDVNVATVSMIGKAPSAPAIPSLVRKSSTSVKVAWAAPAAHGFPVSGYLVTATPGNKSCTTTSAKSCVISGLSAGTTYTFKVKAKAGPLASAASPGRAYTAG